MRRVSKEIKNLTMPINKIEFTETTNPSLNKCSIYVMHSNENLNNSSFSDESILYASKTLKNIPILASIKRDEDYNPVDFEGHEMEIRLIERSNGDYDWKTVYIEKPIGVIPESNNYRIETLENGEKWVVVDGYIWKEYSNGAYDLLKNEDKKVSMEISVDEGYFDDSFMYHIEKYNYLGVTVLGNNYPPAMGSNAVISLFNENDSAKEEYNKLLNEIETLKDGDDLDNQFEEAEVCEECGKNPCECEDKSEEEMAKKKKCSKCETEVETDENFDETEEYVCENCLSEQFTEKENFELSHDEIREKLRLLVKTENTYCYVVQTFDDYFIYQEEKYDECFTMKFYRQGYQIDDNNIKLFDDKVEVFARYITKEEMDKLDAEKQEFETKMSEIKSNYADLQANISCLQEENAELREYKAKVEKAEFEANEEARKLAIDEALEKYSELETVDGYSELIKDRYTADLTELEKSIKVFCFDNNITLGKKQGKKNFAKETGNKVPYIGKSYDNSSLGAWDIISKHIKK